MKPAQQPRVQTPSFTVKSAFSAYTTCTDSSVFNSKIGFSAWKNSCLQTFLAQAAQELLKLKL